MLILKLVDYTFYYSHNIVSFPLTSTVGVVPDPLVDILYQTSYFVWVIVGAGTAVIFITSSLHGYSTAKVIA